MSISSNIVDIALKNGMLNNLEELIKKYYIYNYNTLKPLTRMIIDSIADIICGCCCHVHLPLKIFIYQIIQSFLPFLIKLPNEHTLMVCYTAIYIIIENKISRERNNNTLLNQYIKLMYKNGLFNNLDQLIEHKSNLMHVPILGVLGMYFICIYNIHA